MSYILILHIVHAMSYLLMSKVLHTRRVLCRSLPYLTSHLRSYEYIVLHVNTSTRILYYLLMLVHT